MFDLAGRVALVTGAASGIGRAIALGLDACGAHVALADRDAAGARAVAAKLRRESLVVEVNVTQETEVQAMVEKVLIQFGHIDISFNVPGINVRKPAVELTANEWRSVVDVNLNAAFLCAREVGKVMLQQQRGSPAKSAGRAASSGRGGRPERGRSSSMINIASARGLTGGIGQSVYSVTKAGMIQLTRCLALEWAPHVRVNAIAPGYLKTPLVREIMKDTAWFERIRNLHAMKRFGEPEEVVGAAIFLASDASTFVTGAVLSVDGGWTAGQG
jgi:NAD(P)-dependent dehydrogenase (short-subunit alcohol dehydrogenase family)